MPTNEREFRGAIKKVSVQGETKIDKDGAITAEPEVILTITLPLDRRSIEAMGFLAAVKQAGECQVSVKALQGVMEFTEAVARA